MCFRTGFFESTNHRNAPGISGANEVIPASPRRPNCQETLQSADDGRKTRNSQGILPIWTRSATHGARGRADRPRLQTQMWRNEQLHGRQETGRRWSPALEKCSPTLADRSLALASCSPALENRSPALASRSPAFENRSPALGQSWSALEKCSPPLTDRSPALASRSSAVASRSLALENRFPALGQPGAVLEKCSPTLTGRSLALASRSPALENCSPALGQS